MTRGQRLTAAGIALASAAVVTTMLTAFSSATEGPLTTALDRVGVAFNSLEQDVRERLSGPGRRHQLAWFERYRGEPARLHQPSSILVGAFDSGLPNSFEGVRNLERALDSAFPLVQVYTAWGDNAEHQFPLRAVTSTGIWDRFPVITWEPWLSVFDNARPHPSAPARSPRPAWPCGCCAWRVRLLYRCVGKRGGAVRTADSLCAFAHEMNDPYRYPWGPTTQHEGEFIAAWRHVVARFRRVGAQNVIWVWSPHVARQYWHLYYPGAEFVDWTGTGALNFGPSRNGRNGGRSRKSSERNTSGWRNSANPS
jgi:hypothetical protein